MLGLERVGVLLWFSRRLLSRRLTTEKPTSRCSVVVEGRRRSHGARVARPETSCVSGLAPGRRSTLLEPEVAELAPE